MISIFIKIEIIVIQLGYYKMRNDYTPLKKGKKVQKAVPMKRGHIQKPIMTPIVIVPPFFVL